MKLKAVNLGNLLDGRGRRRISAGKMATTNPKHPTTVWMVLKTTVNDGISTTNLN